MNRQHMVQKALIQLQVLFPWLPRPEHKALAGLLCGAVLAHSLILSRIVSHLPSRAREASKVRRAQRLVANPRLDVRAAQDDLCRRALRDRRGRVDLLLDATTTGASAHEPGTTSLIVMLARRGRAQPLRWRTWPAHQQDQDWSAAFPALLAPIAAAAPAEVDLVLQTDRGLGNANMARVAVAAGMHFLLRITKCTQVQLPDGTVLALGDLAPAPGTSRLVTGARIGPARTKRGRTTHSDWSAALVVNVVAVWRRGDREPWLLITDLPAQRRRCTEYRRRTWEELALRDSKRLGFDWGHSRIRKPERVERLLLVLALALLWLLATTQRVVRRGQRRLVDSPGRRTLSEVEVGRRWLHRRLTLDQRVPCYLSFLAIHAAPLKLSCCQEGAGG
jgi:hypothetical protein